MLKVIKFIIIGIVGLHIMGGLAMFVREWWLFRKSKVRARKIAEPHKTEPPKYSEEIEKVKRDVELAAEIRRILAKSTIRYGEGEYEFDANKLTASEYQLLLNYAKERKKKLDSYVDLCNKISDEPEADCSEEMKLIYGNVGLVELAKFVEAESNKENR